MEEEEHIWELALDPGPANGDVNFLSWEAFENPGHIASHPPYITESGPGALDAALLKDDQKVAAGRVIRGHVLLQSLWSLGLGRSSLLFNWDEKLRTFVPAIPDGRASGLSPSSAKSLTNYFLMTGSTFVYLRSFVEHTFASSTSIPARVALATCVSSILTTFEDHLGRHSNDIPSLLQLQHLFARPRDVLVHIARIVDAVKYAKTNEQFSSILHHRVLESEEDNVHLRQLSVEILRRVSQPSMELLSEWIGIKKEQNIMPTAERGSFVVVEGDAEDQGPPEYSYNPEMMPRFVTPEDGNMVFETGNSLRFLKVHHPEHPLASMEKHGIQPPAIEWKFGWQDIEAISVKAKTYEDDLRAAILHSAQGSPSRIAKVIPPANSSISDIVPGVEVSEVDFARYLQESAEAFDEIPGSKSGTLPDDLQFLVSQLLSIQPSEGSTQSFSPPVSLTFSLSVRPLLMAQARLVNATSLRLFLRSHQLRLHLSLQRQYQLLGNGIFSSRLASALFDPERESAERHKGTMRSGVHMGLQLGSRSTWPPASSELRLALMGVLSETYYSSELYHSSAFKGDQKPKNGDELPGQLNFAVRQLAEAEMEKIMDPDSLYALDFLRLQYAPPSPLNLIISSSALEKYDIIFKFLLRLLRILFVVSRLPRWYPDVKSRYFRMEAHHFVTAISLYIFQTGIAEHWDAFEAYVSTVETRLAEEDAAGEFGTGITSGLVALKSAHEKCLDNIMFSLLLRSRQKKVMSLLEEIFDHILLFAKIMRDEEQGRGGEVKDLYAKLKGKIKVFISVCRGLTGKRGYGKGKGSAEENTLERLCLLLEMNGYYVG